MFINSNVINAIEPPIAEAQSWISGRTFPEEKPLINLAQAVPSYPPAQSSVSYTHLTLPTNREV